MLDPRARYTTHAPAHTSRQDQQLRPVQTIHICESTDSPQRWGARCHFATTDRIVWLELSSSIPPAASPAVAFETLLAYMIPLLAHADVLWAEDSAGEYLLSPPRDGDRAIGWHTVVTDYVDEHSEHLAIYLGLRGSAPDAPLSLADVRATVTRLDLEQATHTNSLPEKAP